MEVRHVRPRALLALGVALVVLAAGAVTWALVASAGPVSHKAALAATSRPAPSTTTAPAHHRAHHRRHHARSHPTITTTTTTTSTTTTTTTTTVPAAAAGLVPGRVTILGDSVTIDAAPDLTADIKGADVEAVVGEQWSSGVAQAQSLRAQGRLGAMVVVALGTNGPISSAEVDQMMQALAGCSRVVFVTNHVPDWWQNPNNQVLEAAPSRYPTAVVADWEALAAGHPDWFYSDGTHMPIGGPGAQAMAALIASKL